MTFLLQRVTKETGQKSGTTESLKKTKKRKKEKVKRLVHSVLKYVYSIETSTRVKWYVCVCVF